MYRPSNPSRVDQIWSEQKNKLLIEFKDLNENDLNFETGRKFEMIERIRVKLGKSEEEIKAIFESL